VRCGCEDVGVRVARLLHIGGDGGIWECLLPIGFPGARRLGLRLGPGGEEVMVGLRLPRGPVERSWAAEETTPSFASSTAADQRVPQMGSLQGHAREGHLIEEE
jgi:hypothetical protein